MTHGSDSFRSRGKLFTLWDLINYGITSDRQTNRIATQNDSLCPSKEN